MPQFPADKLTLRNYLQPSCQVANMFNKETKIINFFSGYFSNILKHLQATTLAVRKWGQKTNTKESKTLLLCILPKQKAITWGVSWHDPVLRHKQIQSSPIISFIIRLKYHTSLFDHLIKHLHKVLFPPHGMWFVPTSFIHGTCDMVCHIPRGFPLSVSQSAHFNRRNPCAMDAFSVLGCYNFVQAWRKLTTLLSPLLVLVEIIMKRWKPLIFWRSLGSLITRLIQQVRVCQGAFLIFVLLRTKAITVLWTS